MYRTGKKLGISSKENAGVFKMSFKYLNIQFKEMNDLFSSIDQAIKSGKGLNPSSKNILIFDSEKTFNNILTVNKLQILRAISQLEPKSIYQLAMILKREPQHVLKDCRQLEFYKFIKLETKQDIRNSIKPVLAFDYDIIKTNSQLISPYTISARSEKILLGQTVET
jgi:predicted transcriptional regulator